MSTRTELLELLTKNQSKYISGQQIGETLNVSRNAIWKATEQLRKDGYNIESKPRIGYKLIGGINLLSKDSIAGHLNVPCNLHVLDSIDSTNNYAKGLTVGDIPEVIVANKQTAGRGRLGRTFESPAGTGLYLTIAIKPNFDLTKALFVTMASSIGVCNAIEKVTGTRCKIKWVNDIFTNDKKTCGILTEATTNFETGQIDSLIIGIGVNCFPGSFPDELKDIAGSVSPEQDSFSRGHLAAEIVNQICTLLENFQDKKFLTEYRRRCFILGKNITIHPSIGKDTAIKARAIDIDDDGGLIVEYMEGIKQRQMETLTTGEVSVRADW